MANINPPFVTELGLMVVGAYSGLGENDTRYRATLHSLLPQGPAFDFEDPELHDLLTGLSYEYQRAESEAWIGWLEMHPSTTTFLVERWERLLGLPGDCGAASEILDDRRAAIAAKLIAKGGGSRSFFELIASKMGYTITIVEGHSEAFRAGRGRAGAARASGLGSLFRWTVSASSGSNDTQLQCIFDLLRPAHTTTHWNLT